MSVEIVYGVVYRVDGISKVTLAEMRGLFSSSEEMTNAARMAEARADQYDRASRMVISALDRKHWAGRARRWKAIAKALRVEVPKEARR